MNNVKAAVVQAAPVGFDREATLRKVRELAASAASGGAKLVVFPEAFVSAYPKGLDFRRYFDSAVDVPGPAVEELADIARDNDVYLVIGVIERDGGTLYCTILFFDDDGRYLGKHRKLMPTALERLVWGFGDGSTLKVVDTEIGRIGSVICWENYMPMLRMAMYAQGVELYCAPTVDDRETWLPTMRTIALEGRCFVLSACQFLRRSDCPSHYAAVQGDDPATVLIRGGACIVDPLGTVLVEPRFGEETIGYAELDRRMIPRGKYDLDVAGHYARPDIFKLTINTRPMPPVEFSTSPGAE